MLGKIEKGRQLGMEICVEKDEATFWYFYAVQKKENIYYVYESEIAEKNMACEIFEYEKIFKYFSIEDVIDNYPCKYGSSFKDINSLRGQKIFNVDFYVDQ